MPQPPHLDPSAYAADGGPVGALLIHGYTGSAAETRPMGQYLASQGLTIRCPLLSGHGTTPEDLTRIRWQAWAAEAEAALRELQDRCDTVFVGGLSLGSLLALWLGAGHPEIAALLPMAPAIRVQNRLLPLALTLLAPGGEVRGYLGAEAGPLNEQAQAGGFAVAACLKYEIGGNMRHVYRLKYGE